MSLLMLTLMSRVFSLVMLMLCLCASENQPLRLAEFSQFFLLHILPLKCVIPNFVMCFVFLGMTFSFIKLSSSSDTLTKREAVILNICPLAIITSEEVII